VVSHLASLARAMVRATKVSRTTRDQSSTGFKMTTFAVIDVETTGLSPYRNDRVLEVAVVLVSPGHGATDEFSTLVNPDRDVGPTSIHGITATDVINAPRFSEVAPHLATRLRPSVALVGHCVAFDAMFLRAEFERIGVAMPMYATIDTRRLVGSGTLASCCADYGIEFDGKAHAALHDARATAHLFERLVGSDPSALRPHEPLGTLEWPRVPFAAGRLLPRTEPPKFSHSSSPFLERLIERKKASLISPVLREAEREYSTLLHRVLEDRRIESTEASALLDVANHWGLSTEQVETIHLAYLSDLAGAALADGHVTEAELRELQSVSQLLGFGSLSQTQFGSLAQDPGMAQVPDKTDAADSWVGKSVCFTGECQCGLGGVPISRPRAEALARARGLVVQPSVTKKLDLLVVADPNTQSSKAKKARQYGIRVVHESVFWRNLGVTID